MARLWLIGSLLILFAGALAFRAPKLALRPMHGDEAINTVKLGELWDSGKFIYDPHEYHGPSLFYFTLPSMLAGPRSYPDSIEFTYRIVPALFGAALVLLLWLVCDGLGRWETIAAGILLAISPAMVFYSRYYIHEMPLVFFTAAFFGCAWRYARHRKVLWAICAGIALGLMHATKETFVIAIAAMAWGVIGMFLWARFIDRTSLQVRRPMRWKVLAAGLFVAACVSLLFFSAFGTHPRGILDSVLTYKTYLERGSGDNVHDKPFLYYLELLAWFRYGRGPISSEGLILLLAVIGVIASLIRRPGVVSMTSGGVSPVYAAWFMRFLAFYTLSLTFFYSIIPYKTPWCMLSFLHGLILLAGVGAVALVRWMRFLPLRILMSLVLMVAAAELGWQSYRTSYLYPADTRRNPYVYSQPGLSVPDWTRTIHRLATLHPQKYEMPVVYLTADIWPAPWYLRRFSNAGQLDELSPNYFPPVIITDPSKADSINASAGGRYAPQLVNLRPKVSLTLLIEQDLWTRYLRSLSAVAPQTDP
jgi:uncharacterized protein (TIGR03663 family)